MHLLSTEGDVCNRKDKTTTTTPTTLSATTQPVITTTVTKYVIPRSSQQPLQLTLFMSAVCARGQEDVVGCSHTAAAAACLKHGTRAMEHLILAADAVQRHLADAG